MNRLRVREPISAGMLLTYKCTGACMHCMYACSPGWQADWMSEEDARTILSQLAGRITASPYGADRIGINHGLHFTGGEPFLNFDLLLSVTKIASQLGIPSTFVETNCFWCTSDDVTRDKLVLLKRAGLDGILISVNPFILEEVPFEKTQRGFRIAEEVFQQNAIVYQRFFYDDFVRLGITNSLRFEEFLLKAPTSLAYVELLPMGRAPYKLGHLFRKYRAERFFGSACADELTREWHVHIDNYGNYIPGYCGGISLGNAHDLDLLTEGIDLKQYPILRALATDIKGLYEFGVTRFGYEELREGYISKCHLCVDLRRHIAGRTDEFTELRPSQFYNHVIGP